MARLLTRMLSGRLVIGRTGEESGFGLQAIGQGLQGLTLCGSRVIGRREGEAGYGFPDIGNTVKKSRAKQIFLFPVIS